MENRTSLTVAAILLIVLGVVMIYLGGFSSPKVIMPPIVTGIGFFAIAWVFLTKPKR